MSFLHLAHLLCITSAARMTYHFILSSFLTLYLICLQPLMRACSSHLPLLASIFAQVTSPLSPIDAAGVSDPLLYPLPPSSSNHQNSRVGPHPSFLICLFFFSLSDLGVFYSSFGQCPAPFSSNYIAQCCSCPCAHASAACGIG